MTFLTDAEITERYGPEKGEIRDWLKQKRLPNTRTNRALATRKITAAKIKKTLGKEIAVLESAGNWQVIYGECRVGGTITFAHTTGDNANLHMVVTIAGHEIDSVQKLYLDGQEVIFGASPDSRWSTGIKDLKTGQIRPADHKIFMAVNNGNPSNPAIADLVAQCPDKWTSAHKQTGRAHAYILIKWDAILFPNGRPEISFLVRGKKCYDPRTSTTAWTQNPALQILDYLTNTQYGVGENIADIETASGITGSFYDGADLCDEEVPVLAGGTEKRYTGNGYFVIGESHQTIIEELCTAMGGSIATGGDKYKCVPARYFAPEITLDENDILSELRVTTRISRRDNFNAVKGTYVSPQANYEETDFPSIRNSYYKAQDNNEEIFEDIQLPYTQSGATAQRLAKIELERIRQPITVELTATLKAYLAEVGETIKLTWPRFGWVEKIFEIEELEPVPNGDGGNLYFGIRLVLRETAEAVLDWNAGQETRVDLAPNTTLPNAFSVQVPTGLTLTSGTTELYVRHDGTVFSRIKVAWTPMTDFFVTSGGTVEVQYRKTGTTNWSVASPIPGELDFTHILDVQDGASYDVRARARSAFGVYSEFSPIAEHVVVGKTERPSNVTGFAVELGKYGVFFKWDRIADLDEASYEIRVGELDDTWEECLVIAEATGNSKQVDLILKGSYKFLIKAIDTSQNYSLEPAIVTLNLNGPSAPNVSFELIGENLVLSWTPSIGLFETKEYEIRYGDDFNLATVEARIKGTSYQRKVDWSDTRKFWVVGIDVADNLGTPTPKDVTIIAPSKVNNLTVDVIDNNVLLKWTAPTSGNLPIIHYKVKKGNPYGSAVLVGNADATFSALFEILSGNYTYWIVPTNSALIEGTPTQITALVNQPPDFVILDDQIIDPDTGTGINILIEENTILMAVNEAETFEDHFINNGWSTPEDQINDGFPYYFQPTPDFGYWEKVIDYGAVFDGTLINLSFDQEDIIGTPDVKVYIAYSPDGDAWVEAETNQVYGTNFRYVRIRFVIGDFPVPSGTGVAMGVLGLTYPS